MNDKYQLHVSGLNTLARCGIQFEKRYIQGIRTSPSVSAAIGLAVDRAVSRDLVSKKDNGELLPTEEIRDIARDSLVREWDRGVEASGEDTESGIEASRDRAIDMSVGLANLHHTTAAPNIRPTHVQRAWTLDVEGLPIQLAGTIDIQEADAIRDTKTSTKPPVKTVADTSLQLTMYSLAVRQHDGAIPNYIGLDYLIRTPKRGDEKLIQIATRRTERDFLPLLERVYQASRQIEAGVFSPADPMSWACSEKFCSFWRTCKFAMRPVSVAASSAVKVA